MEKLLESIPLPKGEDLFGNMTSTQCQELSAFLKQRTQFYREENARLEALSSHLKVLNDDVKLAIGNYGTLKEMQIVCEKFQTKNLNNNTLALSQTEKLRKHNNYISKLRTCIKVYMNLNEKLSENIRVTKSELEQAKFKVDSIANINVQEIQQLENKARRYEGDLMKFEKKYPWLKDPDFDLPSISKEIDMLSHLKGCRDKLFQDLNIYQGLKPDLKEASQQLADIKEEHKLFILNNISKVL